MEGLYILEQDSGRYLCYKAGDYSFGGNRIQGDEKQVAKMLRKLADQIDTQVLKSVPISEIEGLEAFLGRYEEPKVRYQPDQLTMLRELIGDLRSVVRTAQLKLKGWIE